MTQPAAVHDAQTRFRQLLRITGELAGATGRDELIAALVNAMLGFLRTERVVVFIGERADRLTPVLGRYRDDPGRKLDFNSISWSAVRQALIGGQPRLIYATGHGQEIEPSASMEALDLKTVICAPLICPPVGGNGPAEASGVLYADSSLPLQPLTQEDLQFLALLAEQSALLLRNVALLEQLAAETADLSEKMRAEYHFQRMIGESPAMRQVYGMLETLRELRVDVLVAGETGTGKELIAKTLHFNSPRSHGPFVEVNSAALPPDLVEAELFGVERRVATEIRAREGLVEQANGGTLFLDEIGDMPVTVQIKILRFLQDRMTRRLGGQRELLLDVRLVAATNKDLAAAVAIGSFRQDLWFRLNAVMIELPPLRERGTDILLLAYEFLRRFGQENDIAVKGFSAEAEQTLLAYAWPGNVRELIRVVHRSALLAQGHQIRAHHLGFDKAQPVSVSGYLNSRRDYEAQVIRRALSRTNRNVSQAARQLGITRKTLYQKITDLGLNQSDAADS